MSRVFLISYDLIKPEKDYKDLIAGIKAISGSWCRVLASVWLVKAPSTETPASLGARVRSLIDGDDKLYVADVTGDQMAWWNLSDEISTWIKNNYNG